MSTTISKATLSRLPEYLQFLCSPEMKATFVSATMIAKALRLGEVQVRKDLSSVSDGGKPKIGYERLKLIENLESALGFTRTSFAVIVGAGKLGKALLEFDGFVSPAPEIIAAFDTLSDSNTDTGSKPVLPMEQFHDYCLQHDVHIGIITVPVEQAQKVCDNMVDAGITAIWNFAPVKLHVPQNVIVQQENLVLSLAHLNMLANHSIIENTAQAGQKIV